MAKNYDFKKEWPRIQSQLDKFSKEAMVVLKKGEDEVVRLSKEGKLRVDSTTLSVKKEHLFYLIGKEFVKSGDKKDANPKIKKLLNQFEDMEKALRDLERKIKATKKNK